MNEDGDGFWTRIEKFNTLRTKTKGKGREFGHHPTRIPEFGHLLKFKSADNARGRECASHIKCAYMAKNARTMCQK